MNTNVRRVVLTGMGPVSSIGIGVTNFTEGLRCGRSGVSPITAFDTTGYGSGLACEVRDFEPDGLDCGGKGGAWMGGMGRATEFAVAASRLALRDSGISTEDIADTAALVCVGTTDGESHELDQLVAQWLESGPESLSTLAIARTSPARLSSEVVRRFGLRNAEAVTVPTACAAGNYAIGHGYDAIRLGDVDIAICGGADAVCRKTFSGFFRVGTIAPKRCQPFDAGRQGILTGEGAGMLVMESLDSARRRGARIHAEVLGYGVNCDANHPVAPDEGSLARCMRLAHEDAAVDAAEIDFISAHGTGTRANDVTESLAIRQVFEAPPPTISIKSMLGHTMGAASALGAIACAVGISNGFIPPTINHEVDDPECGLDCVPNQAREQRLRIVQNNGLAFGGNNCVVVLGSGEEIEA